MKRTLTIMLMSTLFLLSACKQNAPANAGCASNIWTPPGSTLTDPSSSTKVPVVSTALPDATIPTTMPTAPTISVAPTIPTGPSMPSMPGEDSVLVRYMPTIENGGVTFTGLAALPTVEYVVWDPLNQRQISEERIDHAFGAASEGAPHWITVENQSRFDEWGTDALAWDNISQEKVLYLTFDCGYEYEDITTQVLDILAEKQVKTTFFCTMTYLRSAPEVVARMIAEGHNVGNHSLSHPSDCASLSREEMVLEALAVENYLRVNFGYSSRYFRFPSGVYSENAVEALSALGYRCIFWSIAYADWDPENQMGEAAAFDILTGRLHPGAVILLHTTSRDNAAILADYIDYCLAQGYVFRMLEDYPGWPRSVT